MHDRYEYRTIRIERTDKARAKFLRRAELTIRTGVRLARLVSPPA